jgi:pSer/pThr/pTyr-binding forkhead associated (FHA) protein
MGELAVNTNGFYIEIIPREGETRCVTLKDTNLIVGRSHNSCGLVLDDPRISRVHIRITYNPDHGVTVTDLHSANGTRFEGHRLAPAKPITWLVDQSLSVGDTRIILHYGQIE